MKFNHYRSVLLDGNGEFEEVVDIKDTDDIYKMGVRSRVVPSVPGETRTECLSRLRALMEAENRPSSTS